MLIGGIITGNLLPWLLAAPAIPLLLLLLNRQLGNKLLTALALLCTASILTNMFIIIARDSPLQQPFLQISFMVEFLFAGLLLKQCTPHTVLKYSILSAILIFLTAYISFMALAPSDNLSALLLAGTLIIFLISILVLFQRMNLISMIMTSTPEFWFSGGIFLHFGLLALILLTSRSTNSLNFHDMDSFRVLYGLIFYLQFIFFGIGILTADKKERGPGRR